MDIAPFRGLRFCLEALPEGRGAGAKALTAPPYDVISPAEHRRLLEHSPRNISVLTLGEIPGEASSYEGRGRTLEEWRRSGVLAADEEPAFYVYCVRYPAIGAPGFLVLRGLVAVGRLHKFADGVVLPHERTFPRVVEDRHKLLSATRANLESILLLYSDPAGAVDSILERFSRTEPLLEVETRPGETHALHRISDVEAGIRLTELMRVQRPIIADGHHRYTTSLRYFEEGVREGRPVPGAGWQMMTFANLHSPGVSILATHRLLTLPQEHRSEVPAIVDRIRERLASASSDGWELRVETRTDSFPLAFPGELREGRGLLDRTAYALLNDVVLDDWVREWTSGRATVAYLKDGTERGALERGHGEILFRMRPVDRGEFESVVSAGGVYPHKTTFFYPKLWSGLVLWALEEPEPLALK